MAQKISITLNILVRFKLIANGERIIEQTGPDEHEIEVSEGDVGGESRIEQLHKLLDEGCGRCVKSGPKRGGNMQSSNPVVLQNGGSNFKQIRKRRRARGNKRSKVAHDRVKNGRCEKSNHFY